MDILIKTWREKMNTAIKSAFLLGTVSLLAACGAEDTTTQAAPQNYHDITTTLQGSIFNALDGSRITDESLKVTLVQGSNYRNANLRKGDNEFAGDYSISDIPTSTSANITYRIVTTADGYQPIETDIAFNTNLTAGGAIQDRRNNAVGNMYMFPLGTYATDVKVNVTFNNEPVENATVLLNPITAANVLTTDSSNTIFTAANGFQQATTALTDASGVATFAAAGLVLGGQYNIDVMPATYEGVNLAQNSAGPITIGATANNNVVTMTELVNGSSNGLYVTSATNQDTDAITSNGSLTLTFSRAVKLVDERNILATLAGDDSTKKAQLDTSAAPNTTVNAVLATDGLSLTLTPAFTTIPVNFNGTNNETIADDNLSVVYSNVMVRIAATNDTVAQYDVFGLSNGTGGNPSASVQTTIDFN
ncbi:MAG: hypothetical protein ACI8SR_002115 [Oceanicoccus sp.]